MKLLVTGATGTLGGEVLVAARSAGLGVRGMSRRVLSDTTRAVEWVEGDLATGHGLDEALRGVDAVVHTASDSRHGDEVDVNGTQRLVEAARKANIRHIVFVSIVGVDEIPFGYFKQKLKAEQIVTSGAVPFSILRATQFHSFVDQLIGKAARLPFVIALPAGFVVQSVAVSEVAERVMRCVAQGPKGRVPDFGGPDVMPLKDAAQLWREARHVNKRIVPVPVPGAVAAAFRAGKHTTPRGERGTISWAEWLMHTRDR
jgi:uncharacterized protein YbjT (DUF2867 family)